MEARIKLVFLAGFKPFQHIRKMPQGDRRPFMHRARKVPVQDHELADILAAFANKISNVAGTDKIRPCLDELGCGHCGLHILKR